MPGVSTRSLSQSLVSLLRQHQSEDMVLVSSQSGETVKTWSLVLRLHSTLVTGMLELDSADMAGLTLPVSLAAITGLVRLLHEEEGEVEEQVLEAAECLGICLELFLGGTECEHYSSQFQMKQENICDENTELVTEMEEDSGKGDLKDQQNTAKLDETIGNDLIKGQICKPLKYNKVEKRGRKRVKYEFSCNHCEMTFKQENYLIGHMPKTIISP